MSATLVGAAFGTLSAGVALVVATHMYQLEGYSMPLDVTGAGSILLGSIAYASMFGALGAALGALVRNQVGAIVGCLAWLFVVEQIVLGIAPSLGRYLPAAAGRALIRDPGGDLLAQPAGGVMLALYAAAIVVIGMYFERRRDA